MFNLFLFYYGPSKIYSYIDKDHVYILFFPIYQICLVTLLTRDFEGALDTAWDGREFARE